MHAIDALAIEARAGFCSLDHSTQESAKLC